MCCRFLSQHHVLFLKTGLFLTFPPSLGSLSEKNNTKLLPLKDGAAKLAIATNKPIVPIHLTGVAHVKEEVGNYFLPPLNSRIRIKFGKPIYPENMDVQELNELLRQKIEELN